MRDFVYYSPTEVIFGRDSEQKTAAEVIKFGGTRVLVVYGGGSIQKSGLLYTITEQLIAAGLFVCEFGGALPNPRLSHVREGILKAGSFGVDFILAVGGGSAIDTAKAIAHGAANPDTDVWDIWTMAVPLSKSLPHGAVLTISAAGSETSASAVITNDETNEKRGLPTDFNRPKFAIMNPALTFSVPLWQLRCGIADIMMHTVDRYPAQPGVTNHLTDGFAEALLRTVVDNAPKLLKNPDDYDAASEIMWCGSVSHNGLTGLGLGDFAVHQLAHELSGRWDVTHGAALTAVWSSYARYVCGDNPARFAKLGRAVFGDMVEKGDDMAAAESAISAFERFFVSLKLPIRIKEFESVGEIDDETINSLAHGCSFSGKRKIGIYKLLSEEDMAAIYRLAR